MTSNGDYGQVRTGFVLWFSYVCNEKHQKEVFSSILQKDSMEWFCCIFMALLAVLI